MFEKFPFFKRATQEEAQEAIVQEKKGKPSEKEREEVKAPEKSEEIKIPEIAELRKPMEKLLLDMRENIERGEYAVIFGDDASGRIPTLLFRKVLTASYEEHGFNVPQTLFFAGKRALSEEKIDKVRGEIVGFLTENNIKNKTENKKSN